MVHQFTLPAPFARRLPDPGFGETHNVVRHILFVPVQDVPQGIPLDPNPRGQNLNKRVYKDVRESLLNETGEPGTFHLKHKGITVVADRVDRIDSSGHDYTITFKDGQGILDGGHSYMLITETQKNDPDLLPKNQFVKFEVLTNIPQDWITDIAGGLNTSVQVQPMSLDHLSGKFEWLMTELKGEPYESAIAWRENDPGQFDARDVISLLYCFNIFEFPNTDDRHPVEAYSSKAKVLNHFEKNTGQYERLQPILKDILVLHDLVRRDARRYWNEAGGKYGAFSFVEDKKKTEFSFPFAGGSSKYRLTNGAAYPMIAAFRWLVEEDPNTGDARWRGGFDSVRNRWEKTAEELIRVTAQANTELGRNPNAIGKSKNHWANLHARVAMRDLMEKTKK